MNELSLFSGAGGGLLGSMLLGWRPVGYVEWDDYCQRIIAARIRDGYLPNAPIFGDIHAFIHYGYADSYQGLVDVVSAGFPCPPFSVAGKMAGADDPRNGWPATIDVVRIVQPRWVWLENVPGLVTGSHGYFRTILSDLSESGYSVRWRHLSAAELGAPHLRDRIWIVAHADRLNDDAGGHCTRSGILAGSAEDTDANTIGQCPKENVCQSDPDVWCRSDVVGFSRTTYWQDGCPIEPAVCRVADGVATWVDRIAAIGNGQVPAVAARAWIALTQDIV